MSAVLSRPFEQDHLKVRATALNGAGGLAKMQGDYVVARALYEESLKIKRELGNKQGIAASLRNLGCVTQEQGDYAAARALHEESLTLCRELGDKFGIAYSLLNLGHVAQAHGDYVAARALYEQGLTLFRELGTSTASPTPLTHTLSSLTRSIMLSVPPNYGGHQLPCARRLVHPGRFMSVKSTTLRSPKPAPPSANPPSPLPLKRVTQ